MEISVLHLSDLHLGRDLAWRRLRPDRWFRSPNDPEILNALSSSIGKLKPDYVVISGDIVNTCSPDTFRYAQEQLTKMFSLAGFDIRRRLLVIPGNHDVEVFPEEDQYFGRLREFVTFLKQLFGEEDYRSRTERFALCDEERKLCFFALDSTLKRTGSKLEGQPIAEGMVGAAQLRWLERKVEKFQARYPDWSQYVKVAVLHHHPHPIADAGSDRFMQLIDAGEVIRALSKIGVHVVLHGHKHFPHAHTYLHDSGQYTVLGAGTAACAYEQEQANEGNNFNLVTITPEANVLQVVRYRATSKQFAPAHTIKMPLVRPSDRGYRIAEHEFQTIVRDLDGNCDVIDQRRGLRADSDSGGGLSQIRFFIGGLPENASIVDFSYDTDRIKSVDYKENHSRERDGAFVLKFPLEWGGKAFDLAYHAKIDRGIRLHSTGSGADPYEAVELTSIHPCDRVRVTAQFPQGYRVTPQIRVRDHNLVEQQTPESHYRLRYDDSVNRHSLEVLAPRLDWEYSLKWKRP